MSDAAWLALLGLLLLTFLLGDLYRGTTLFRQFSIRRADRPLLYWLFIAFLAYLTYIVFAAAVSQA